MSWFAFEVETTRELLVVDMIRDRLGYVGFTPMVAKQVRRGIKRRLVVDQFPAFPRYVFACFNHFHPWDAIKRVERLNHVYGVMGLDNAPLEIPSSQMEHVLKLNGTIMNIETKRAIQAGDGATIRQDRHPFDGHVVNVVAVNGKYAEVVAKLFGRHAATLKVPVKMLEAA